MTQSKTVDQPKQPPLWILLLLVSFAAISAVLFTPALPEITKQLGISASQAEFTITVFLIGYALGNLPYGPIANRFGRKSALYVGIILALIGSFLVVLVGFFPMFWLLILGRFLTALGSSAGLTIAFTMVGDAYRGESLTKKISYFMLVFAMGPGIAVALGGFLTSRFGWESCFYFLSAYSLFLLIVTYFLPETTKEVDYEALHMTKIKEGYIAKLKNKRVVVSSLIMGCGASFVYLFASEAPFLGINHIGLTAETYGLFNFIPPIGMIVGSMLANALAGKKDPVFVILLGVSISLLSSLSMLMLFLFESISVWALFLPMPFIYVGISLVFSNASSLAMSYAKNKSNGSAMMNCLNLSVCVCILLIVEFFASHQLFILPIVFIVTCFIMLVLRRVLKFVLL